MRLLKDNVIIIAICGMSGSGKDTFARMLENLDFCKRREHRQMAIIPSFTTRPMRIGETNGREHIFLSEMPKYKDNELFAYTLYGGYHYWTTELQLRNWSQNLYVIDEVGIRELEAKERLYHKYKTDYKSLPPGHHEQTWEFKLVKVHIERPTKQTLPNPPCEGGNSLRVENEEWQQRIARDKGRDLSDIRWDYEIKNDGTLADLQLKAEELYKKISKLK